MVRRTGILLSGALLLVASTSACRHGTGDGSATSRQGTESARTSPKGAQDAGTDGAAPPSAQGEPKGTRDCRRFCEKLEDCSEETAAALVTTLAGPDLKLSRSLLASVSRPVADELDRDGTCARYCGPKADLFPQKKQYHLVLCSFLPSCRKFARCVGDAFAEALLGRSTGRRTAASSRRARSASRAAPSSRPSSRPGGRRAQCAHACRMLRRCSRQVARAAYELSEGEAPDEDTLRSAAAHFRRSFPQGKCIKDCLEDSEDPEDRAVVNAIIRCSRYSSCSSFGKCFSRVVVRFGF